MLYKAIGLMSGSSLDGLDIAFVHFEETARQWDYQIKAAACFPYSAEWEERLKKAPHCSALEYAQLHVDYGHFLGRKVNQFIEKYHLSLPIDLIVSHGHTVFHYPQQRMTAQIGDGAALAAETGLMTVTDLRNLDVALGGQGAPIVPMGEKFLFPGHRFFLNLGGIANISFHGRNSVIAYDVCPGNRVLNYFAQKEGKRFDEAGNMAKSGRVDEGLLEKLNTQEYYRRSPPKSLANEFGTEILIPLMERQRLPVVDSLRTYCEHMACQLVRSCVQLLNRETDRKAKDKMMITGGGAFNNFLINLFRKRLINHDIEIRVPDSDLVQYKEALITALLGVLRWKKHHTTLASVTGAIKGSVGGAVWQG